MNRFLGVDIPEEDTRKTLAALGFGLEGDTITVPSWRSDVEHWSDIAEEAARFYGYNNIPNTLSAGLNERRGWNPVQQAENTAGAQIGRAHV